MTNSNIQSDNQNEEISMSTIQTLFQEYLTDGGKPQVTSFRVHIEALIKKEIKPLCGRSGKSAGDNDWRTQLMDRFKGRGAKWQFVSLDEITPTLDRFDTEGVDTEDYRQWTQSQGKAWIRFMAPRLNNGVKSAAFTVHTLGSTIYQPHQVHYIELDRLDEVITPLDSTPHALKLEESIQPDEDQMTDIRTELGQEVYPAEMDCLDDDLGL